MLAEDLDELRRRWLRNPDLVEYKRLNDARSKVGLYLYYSGSKGLWLGVFHDDGDVKLQNVPLLNGMRVEDEMDDKGRLGIKLILTEAAGEVVFLDFVEFISGALAPVTDLKKVNATLRQELQRWKKFFSLGQSPLSRPNIIGLAGEIMTLDMLLGVHSLASKDAVTAWVGVESGLHDFVLKPMLIEVKSSISKDHMQFHVFSTQQMFSIDERPLYLIHNEFQWRNDGLSLNDLAKSIEAKLSIVSDVHLYQEKLAVAGYHPIHSKFYEREENRLALIDVRHFSVTDGFPRVEEMPSGVTIKSFDVDLDACVDFELSDFNRMLGALEWS